MNKPDPVAVIFRLWRAQQLGMQIRVAMARIRRRRIMAAVPGGSWR